MPIGGFVLLLAISVGEFFLVWFLGDSIFGGEDFTTNNRTIQTVASVLTARNLQNCTLYDLGSSRGGFLIGLLKLCPGLKIVGIDNSRLRTWVARGRSIFLKNKPAFWKMDIFTADVSKANVIYIYLPRPLLPKIETKLQKELAPGACVLTGRVNLPSWPVQEVVRSSKGSEPIFIYVKT